MVVFNWIENAASGDPRICFKSAQWSFRTVLRSCLFTPIQEPAPRMAEFKDTARCERPPSYYERSRWTCSAGLLDLLLRHLALWLIHITIVDRHRSFQSSADLSDWQTKLVIEPQNYPQQNARKTHNIVIGTWLETRLSKLIGKCSRTIAIGAVQWACKLSLGQCFAKTIRNGSTPHSPRCNWRVPLLPAR